MRYSFIHWQKFSTGSRWVFYLLVLLLCLPNFIWLASTSNFYLNLAEYCARLAQSLLLATAFVVLFSRLVNAWLISWVLCLWWLPASVAVRFITGQPISATLIGTAAASSPAELTNLFAALPIKWLPFFVLWNIGGVWFGVWLSKHPTVSLGWAFRGKVLFFCLSLLAMPWLILPSSSSSSSVVTDNTSIDLLAEFQQADQRLGSFNYLPDTFPYELPWAIAQYWQAKQMVDKVRANLALPNSAYLLTNNEIAAELVVLVIGESSTKNAWHLFNKDAPSTTPLLEQRIAQNEHLVSFNRTLSQTTATRQAVPSLLAWQPLVWPNGAPNPNATLSILSVAKKAGYTTGWFSNQAAVGKHDGIIAAYSHEADRTLFLNPAGYWEQGNFDEALFEPFKQFIASNSNALIVLHTMGSHFNYAFRYPSEFGLYPNTNNVREAYFNTVNYTDMLLDTLIAQLSETQRKAVLLYISDHGETIPDNGCDKETPNRTTRDAYEIPALVWLSDEYAMAHPDITKQLKENQNQYFQGKATVQTLLDLMRGNTSQPLPDNTIQSFARSSQTNEPPEWTVKFERAVERNACFILMN